MCWNNDGDYMIKDMKYLYNFTYVTHFIGIDSRMTKKTHTC